MCMNHSRIEFNALRRSCMVRAGAAFWCVLASMLVLMQGPMAHAQQGLSAEQQRIFSQMTPQQQRDLLGAVAGQGGDGAQVIGEPLAELSANPLALDTRLGGEPMAQPLVPRLEAGSTIVVAFSLSLDTDIVVDPATGVFSQDGVDLNRQLQRLPGQRVYELDEAGVVEIAALFRIPLAGLTVEEAAIRIASEPQLSIFDVTVTLLPLVATGADALELFGRNIFDQLPLDIADLGDLAVPSSYVVGPGDSIKVLLFGSQNAQYELYVNRDGEVQLPGIGPIAVAGLTFEQVHEELSTRVSGQMIGVSVSVTMGRIKTIRVFVTGDVVQPGAYVVSGLTTMTNALLASGGIEPTGSLRRVELRRNGSLIGRLDLYDLLLRGDSRGDRRLNPGDVIFVPSIGQVAGVQGLVNRPGLYELNGETTVGQLVDLAGGLKPEARRASASLARISQSGERTVREVNLGQRSGLSVGLRDGDILRVSPVLEEHFGTVSLVGHVHEARHHEYRPGIRLTSLVPAMSALRPLADTGYVLVRRQPQPGGPISVFSIDYKRALAAPASPANPELMPRDTVRFFELAEDRAGFVRPLIDELSAQRAGVDALAQVGVGGQVTVPGTYPLEAGMRISDLLRASGSLLESAYTVDAELSRYSAANGEYRSTSLVEVNLAAVLAGEREADLTLQAHDFLTIKEMPEWQAGERVRISGEVRFPGFYPIRRGETLNSVLRRAGGLTDLAFIEGSIFVREELREREQDQLEALAQRLESDLVSFSLKSLQEGAEATQVLTLGQQLLSQLRETKATGRLVVEIDSVMASDTDPSNDIILKDGDHLSIPKRTQEVTVLGEVQYATSHIFAPGLERDGYIGRSGGMTQQADHKRIYVVRANGEVLASERSAWFRRNFSGEMRPGDTIVVPIDADRVAPLALWSSVSQIIYQLALAAASANAVGVF